LSVYDCVSLPEAVPVSGREGKMQQDSPIGHSVLTQQIRPAFPRLLAEPGRLRTTKKLPHSHKVSL
jgi:hypothetical protein